ncbi:MAG: hypothetical protein ACI9GZ_003456, partial [Bacteroidia bacterium]
MSAKALKVSISVFLGLLKFILSFYLKNHFYSRLK